MLIHDKHRALPPLKLFLWALAAPGSQYLPANNPNYCLIDIEKKTPLRGVFCFFCYNLIMKLLFWRREELNTGRLGEKIAAEYLKNKGYKILEKNFKNPLGRRLGEIDIIARKGKEVVFVEVKTKKPGRFEGAPPEERITPSKLHKLNKAGQFYIKSKNLWGADYRFDAVSVWLSADQKNAKIKHLENIFI